MRGYAHLSFGAMVGCIVGNCFSYSFMGAVAGGIASILSDIDHPYSLILKPLQPLSSWIESEFGHRGCTHNIWFCLFISILAVIVSRALFSSNASFDPFYLIFEFSGGNLVESSVG